VSLHPKPTTKMGFVIHGVFSEVVSVETFMSSFLISPYKFFFFFGLLDDEESLFACVVCLHFISSCIVFMSVSSSTTYFNISVSSLSFSKMKLNLSVDDDEDGTMMIHSL